MLATKVTWLISSPRLMTSFHCERKTSLFCFFTKSQKKNRFFKAAFVGFLFVKMGFWRMLLRTCFTSLNPFHDVQKSLTTYCYWDNWSSKIFYGVKIFSSFLLLSISFFTQSVEFRSSNSIKIAAQVQQQQPHNNSNNNTTTTTATLQLLNVLFWNWSFSICFCSTNLRVNLL